MLFCGRILCLSGDERPFSANRIASLAMQLQIEAWEESMDSEGIVIDGQAADLDVRDAVAEGGDGSLPALFEAQERVD
jgi:hypothetical protein